MAEQDNEIYREISSLLKTQNTMLAHLGIIVTRLTWMVLALLLIVIILLLVGLFS
jgi:hypothetical protein